MLSNDFDLQNSMIDSDQGLLNGIQQSMENDMEYNESIINGKTSKKTRNLEVIKEQ